MGYLQEYQLYKEAITVGKKYINHEDVNDVFFGSKYIGEIATDIPSIRFNVYEKKPQKTLKSNRVLPKKIGKFLTDVTEFKPEKNRREENPSLLIRPILGGLQIQSSLFTGPSNWGTLGCVLRINGTMYGITNFHVSFGEIPNDGFPPNGLQMLQPKFRNFGEAIGSINSVSNKFLDYSLFRINVPFDNSQSVNGYSGEIEGFAHPIDGMTMFKFGAATGKTFGIFDARSIIDKHRIVIRYDPRGANNSPRISSPGDSGSIWLTTENTSLGNLRMVALHYGGDQDHNVAFASLFSSISASIRNQIPQP